MIQYGEADAAIAGGTESVITPLAVGGFAVMKALSTRNDDPLHASRPWDRDRDGFVIAEGAGIDRARGDGGGEEARRADLRRARRLRHVGRRVPHRGAVGGRRRPGARHAQLPRRRRHRPRTRSTTSTRTAPRRRSATRPRRSRSSGLRGPCEEARGLLDEVDDRATCSARPAGSRRPSARSPSTTA